MSAPAYHNDKLPGYSSIPPTYQPSVGCYGVTLMKTEFRSPYHYNNGRRSWTPVVLELNSTQLNVYELKLDKKLSNLILALYHNENYLEEFMEVILSHPNKESDLFGDLISGDAYGSVNGGGIDSSVDFAATLLKTKLRKSKFASSISKDLQEYYHVIRDNRLLFEPTNDHTEYLEFSKKFRGAKLHCMTMQNLTFGEAPSISDFFKNNDRKNYKLENLASMVKYSNVLRVRIELRQCLFQFWSFHGMVQWYSKFGVGRDLSLTIDERRLAKVKTIPSRYSRWEEVEAAGSATAVTSTNSPYSAASSTTDLFESKDSTSIISRTSSVFDRSRSSSVLSNLSSTSSLTIDNIHSKTFNSFKIISLDTYYNSLEKDYISCCLTKLNTFERWTGAKVTISNFEKYLNPNQLKELSENNGIKRLNIFITPTKLDDTGIWNFRKKTIDINPGQCRQFTIHQHGLVSVK